MSVPTILGDIRLVRPIASVRHTARAGFLVLIGVGVALGGPTLSLSRDRAGTVVGLAVLVLALTMVNVLELLGGSRERDGSYPLLQETLGGWLAFSSGLAVMIGSVSSSVALLGLAGWSATDLLGASPRLSGVFALLFFVLIILIQLYQLRAPQFFSRWGFRLLLFSLFLVIVSVLPTSRENPTPAVPRLGDMRVAIAWMMASFAAFETLLAERTQVKDANLRLPRAVLAVFVIGMSAWTLIWNVLGRLPGNFEMTVQGLLIQVGNASILPNLWISGTGLLVVFGAYHLLQTTVRQIAAFSQEGAFPWALEAMRGPFRRPPGLYGVLLVIGAPLCLLASPAFLLELSAAMFIVVMCALNIAAIDARRNEPDRRRSFSVPFSPLVPGVAIGINLILLQALSGWVLLIAALLLVVGVGYYLAYAHERRVNAQAGETIFGKALPDKKDRYRILVPLGPGEERRLVLQLAVSLARQLGGVIVPLQIIPVPDPLAIEEGQRMAKERNTLFQWSMRYAEKAKIPVYPITRLALSVPQGIIETAGEEKCDLVLLSWAIDEKDDVGRLGRILDPVANGITCDLAVIAYHPEKVQMQPTETGFQLNRVLVPTAGGPHAPLATQIALLLTREQQAAVSTVYIAPPDATPEYLAGGQMRIDQTAAALREQEASIPHLADSPLYTIPIEGQVVQADSVVQGICQAGESCDLIFIGASEESMLDQVLFGNIPEQVARNSETPVVMVKRYRGLSRYWLQRTWRALIETLPQVDRARQTEVSEMLLAGAQPSVDFFVLISLSTLLAAFGLMQNSAAVIIGAMLVAPLFTPLMAMSLSIVQGDVRLLRLAFEAALKGVTLAIGLAIFLTMLLPMTEMTSEILARTQPSLLDLGVALASGVVGGYAIARKEVAAALPGVAIAAALVPPLGVIGIGLGAGNLSVASGATLLVATNLVAIVASGAITMLLLGFRPMVGRGAQLRRGLITTLVLSALITLSLVSVSFQSFQRSQFTQTVRDTVTAEMANHPEMELVHADEITHKRLDDGTRLITIPVYLRGEPLLDTADTLATDLAEALDEPVRVRLVTLDVLENTP